LKREQLAAQFDLLSRLLRISRDNPFKIRSYEFAARTVRSKLPDGELTEQEIHDLSRLKGIGKAITEKSLEFLREGKISKISELAGAMPPAIFELALDGIVDPETIAFMWKDAGLGESESILAFLRKQREDLKLSREELARLEDRLKEGPEAL